MPLPPPSGLPRPTCFPDRHFSGGVADVLTEPMPCECQEQTPDIEGGGNTFAPVREESETVLGRMKRPSIKASTAAGPGLWEGELSVRTM